MKKQLMIVGICLALLILITACNSSDNSGSNASYSSSSSRSGNSSYSSGSSYSSTRHICEVDDCYRTGAYPITGFSGKTEYYCSKHYNEIVDIWNMMNGY